MTENLSNIAGFRMQAEPNRVDSTRGSDVAILTFDNAFTLKKVLLAR